MAELLQLLQGLLTPALLRRDGAASTDPPLGAVRDLGPVLGLPLLVHVDGESPAVKLQHSLLENGRGGEEEEGPDDGEGPLHEAPGARATKAPAALVLPRPQPLQTTWEEEEGMLKYCF